MIITDSHSHLSIHAEDGIAFSVCCDENLESIDDHFELKDDIGRSYVFCGIHPWFIQDSMILENILSKCQRAIDTGRIDGIGEIGMDSVRRGIATLSRQELFFDAFVSLAVRNSLPMSIHCVKTSDRCVAVLKKYSKSLPPTAMHSLCVHFSEAERFLRLSDNIFIGVGIRSIIQCGTKTKKMLRVVPIDKVLIETDWEEGESKHWDMTRAQALARVIEYLSIVYGKPIEDIQKITFDNFKRFARSTSK
ncbi:TatD family like protein [Aduncisulcus paluster]|uniref:TatD family like protein n=1 Tax=Aduncisulcus paluster TaxID=2918883 RepID=A0ABQ5KQ93_9EUKA|nr:TatD family like protein [Aduncisulcus paluster]